MVQGSYTEDITLLGFGIDVAIGLAGWDLPMDLRDLSADFTVNFEPTKLSWWATTAIDVLAVVPVIGAVKYVDDLGALGKNALKGMSKGVDKFKGAFKRAGNFLDGMSSGFRVALKNKDEALKSLKKTMEDGKKKLNEFLNGRFKSGSKAKLDYVTSNGLVLETTPNKTTTVLGTYKSDTGAILDELGNIKSLDFGPRDGGFNLLNTPDELYVSPNQFWNEYNKPWLDNAIARNDIFKIATEPTWDNLTRVNMFTGKTELTGFGREYTYLKKHGYYFDAVIKSMVK